MRIDRRVMTSGNWGINESHSTIISPWIELHDYESSLASC
jgi:hypothetical protein